MEAAGSFETVSTRLHGVTSHKTLNLKSLKETAFKLRQVAMRFRGVTALLIGAAVFIDKSAPHFVPF
jgi:hypothetical protein